MRLYYKDSFGRDIHCHVVEKEELVLFVDESSEHGGMSITNSIEQAIFAYQDEFDGKENVRFFEAYPGDPSSFAEVELRNGNPYWFYPGLEAHHVFKGCW
ncbi:MAG: hypothetical protein WC965_01630 [Thiohalomonadaceae bacterium]